MSTRSQIGFYEPNKPLNKPTALIYRHMDGYPEGVLPDIMPILKDFDRNRGLGDVEYSSAWMVAKLKTDYLNVGICRSLHGDIEWFYAVYPDHVDIYDIPFSRNGPSFKELKDREPYKIIPIKKKPVVETVKT